MQAQGTSVSPLDSCRSFVISAECSRLKDNSLQTLVSKPVRHVLIADKFNLKVWEGASPRYKCITLDLCRSFVISAACNRLKLQTLVLELVRYVHDCRRLCKAGSRVLNVNAEVFIILIMEAHSLITITAPTFIQISCRLPAFIHIISCIMLA